jgi:hypothetical protein
MLQCRASAVPNQSLKRTSIGTFSVSQSAGKYFAFTMVDENTPDQSCHFTEYSKEYSMGFFAFE